MDFSDIRDHISKDDILATFGLATQSSTSQRAFGTLMAAFGVGILVGVGAALLMTPKSGQELREDLGQRIRSLRDEMTPTGSLPNLVDADEAGA